jgi:hypothetical protein
VAIRRLERSAARDDKGERGHAFETFVCGGDDVIGSEFRQIERHSAEAAHRIEDERATSVSNDLRDLVDRVQNTGCRFEMNHRHVRDARRFEEESPNRCWIRRFVLGPALDLHRDLQSLCNLQHSFAIRAVREDEQLSVCWDDRRDEGLNCERAAALHQHRFVAGRA